MRGAGGRGAEGEEQVDSALSMEPKGIPHRSHEPEITTTAETKSGPFNRPSHPGAPSLNCLQSSISMLKRGAKS